MTGSTRGKKPHNHAFDSAVFQLPAGLGMAPPFLRALPHFGRRSHLREPGCEDSSHPPPDMRHQECDVYMGRTEAESWVIGQNIDLPSFRFFLGSLPTKGLPLHALPAVGPLF